MRNRARIYADPLEDLPYEDVFTILSGIGVEGQRLDFKEQSISKRKMAYAACGFANALGGIIAVGIKDPDTTGGVVTESDIEVDISDAHLTSIGSTVQALVYPAITCELFGFTKASGALKKLLIMRVPESPHAPHEYIGHDNKFNLPVRRDREFLSLTLPEIVALQRRRDSIPFPSPLSHGFATLSIDRSISSPLFFFGIRTKPEEYSPKRLVLTESEDRAITRVIRNAKGCNAMAMVVRADGIAFSNGVSCDTTTVNDVNREAYVSSAGDIVLRTQETTSTRIYQVAELLTNSYAIASQAHRILGLGPRVRAHIEMKVNPDYVPHSGELPLPQEYWDDFSFDVSRDTAPDIATDTVLRCLRAAGRSHRREDIRSLIDGVWQREHSGIVMRDLRDDWI